MVVPTVIKAWNNILDSVKAGGFGFQLATKTLTYDGGTANGVGDENGTGDPATLFTVTGDVIVRVVAICQTSLTFAANAAIEVGIAADQDIIIATTDLTAEGMVAKEIWHDATPDKEIEALSTIKEHIISDGNDIKMDTTVANVTGGVIAFYCFWTPLSADGDVVAA